MEHQLAPSTHTTNLSVSSANTSYGSQWEENELGGRHRGSPPRGQHHAAEGGGGGQTTQGMQQASTVALSVLRDQGAGPNKQGPHAFPKARQGSSSDTSVLETIQRQRKRRVNLRNTGPHHPCSTCGTDVSETMSGPWTEDPSFTGTDTSCSLCQRARLHRKGRGSSTASDSSCSHSVCSHSSCSVCGDGNSSCTCSECEGGSTRSSEDDCSCSECEPLKTTTRRRQHNAQPEERFGARSNLIFEDEAATTRVVNGVALLSLPSHRPEMVTEEEFGQSRTPLPALPTTALPPMPNSKPSREEDASPHGEHHLDLEAGAEQQQPDKVVIGSPAGESSPGSAKVLEEDQIHGTTGGDSCAPAPLPIQEVPLEGPPPPSVMLRPTIGLLPTETKGSQTDPATMVPITEDAQVQATPTDEPAVVKHQLLEQGMGPDSLPLAALLSTTLVDGSSQTPDRKGAKEDEEPLVVVPDPTGAPTLDPGQVKEDDKSTFVSPDPTPGAPTLTSVSLHRSAEDPPAVAGFEAVRAAFEEGRFGEIEQKPQNETGRLPPQDHVRAGGGENETQSSIKEAQSIIPPPGGVVPLVALDLVADPLVLQHVDAAEKSQNSSDVVRHQGEEIQDVEASRRHQGGEALSFFLLAFVATEEERQRTSILHELQDSMEALQNLEATSRQGVADQDHSSRQLQETRSHYSLQTLDAQQAAWLANHRSQIQKGSVDLVLEEQQGRATLETEALELGTSVTGRLAHFLGREEIRTRLLRQQLKDAESAVEHLAEQLQTQQKASVAMEASLRGKLFKAITLTNASASQPLATGPTTTSPAVAHGSASGGLQTFDANIPIHERFSKAHRSAVQSVAVQQKMKP